MFVGPRSGAFRLTSIEQKLYSNVASAQKTGNLPPTFVWQQKPEPNDPNLSRVAVDGMFPELKLIVEADGKKWHSSPEDVARDTERDAKLNARGWQVLRFTEDEINYSIDAVIAKIINVVNDLTKTAESENKLIKEAGIEELDGSYFPEDINEEIVKEETTSIDAKIEEVTAGIDDEIEKSFLKTSQRSDSDSVEKLEGISEQISEDLSEENEESKEEMKKIIKEQDELQDLIQ